MPELRLTDQYTYKDMVRAYLDCRRRKRGTMSSISYEMHCEENLLQLQKQVNTGTYTPQPTRVFVVLKPKAREVWAARFRDRIVHHLIYADIGPWYEAKFIEDTYSCIRGRGTLAASQRLEHFCRSVTKNWSRPAWVLQMDIANFFVAIHRPTLWEVLSKAIGTESLTARLYKQLIFHDVTRNPDIITPELLDRVPRHKSLFHCSPDCGLPIGNLPSQFLSNVYLDGLDKYVKHVLKIKYYVRYVDDIVVLADNPDILRDWCKKIDSWMQKNRNLHLHPDKISLKPIHQGINFVGRVVYPWRTYARKSTVASAKQAAHTLWQNPRSSSAAATVQSYLGMLRQSDSFNLRTSLCRKVALSGMISHSDDMAKLIKL